MKKISFLIPAICMFNLLAVGQISLYDDIDLGPVAGNLNMLSNPDWGVTHGTPSYSPTQIWMWSNQYNGYRQGEGLYRRLDFQDGANFQLSIGIVNFTNPVNGSQFKVLLVNDPLPDTCNLAGCPTPTFSTPRVLYTYTGGSFDNNLLTLKFSTAPSETYKYLVIYPEQTVNAPSQGLTTQLSITCLTGYSCAVGDKTYCAGSIPSGTSYYKSIFAGSGFCSLIPFLNSDATSNTRLLGTEKVVLGPNTNITIASGRTFIMDVEPCVSLAGNIPLNTVEATLTPQQSLCSVAFVAEKKWNKLNIPSDKEMKIFPNPSSGIFNFFFGEPLSTAAEMIITSAEGRLIKQERISGTSVTVNLPQVPNGIYFVKINDGMKVITGKIVKQ